VWFKGPMEAVEGANGVETDQMKVVYFKNKSAEAAADGDEQPEAAEGDDAPAGETGQADGQTGEMSQEDVDDEIPF